MNSNIRYAGFWIRTVAAILDDIWLYGAVYGALWFIIGSELFDPTASRGGVRFIFEWILPFFVVMLFWNTVSSTPGKLLLGLKIVDAATYGPVPPHRFLMRYLGYFVSLIPLGIGLIWAGLDDRKQGWHDKIAGTVVIYYR